MGADSKASTSAGGASNRTVEFFELSRPGAEICATLDALNKKTGNLIINFWFCTLIYYVQQFLAEQFKADFYKDYDVFPSGSLSDTLWTCSSQLSLA